MAELIPLTVLFGNPERVSPRLSPDGTQLAWIAPHDGVLNVWLAPVSPGPGVDWAAARVVTDDTDRGIRQFAWAHDGRHLLYLQDTGGDENWRLHDVDLQTMERRDLTPFEGVQAQLIAASASSPTEILIGLNKDNPELHDVYRLDLRTGELTKEVDNPGFIGMGRRRRSWRSGPLSSPSPTAARCCWSRDSAQERLAGAADRPGRRRADHRPGRLQRGRPVAAGDSARSGARERPRWSGSTWRAAGTEVLAADPEADVSDVRIHPDTRRAADRHLPEGPLGVPGAGPVRGRGPAADPGAAPRRPGVLRRRRRRPDLAGRLHQRRGAGLVLRLRPGSRHRAASCSSISPSCRSTSWRRWSRSRSSRRDGLTVHGYLTFPPGAERAACPTVLNVHGGPWARDTWGFDPEAQWLANRGYLCVQVNFRGSTGYGKAFLNAGDREWGARMQDDLTDAVAYVVGQGWADPARVAHLRRLLRRLRGAGRRGVHAGPVLLRRRHRRARRT